MAASIARTLSLPLLEVSTALLNNFLRVSDATVLLGLLGGVQSSKLSFACNQGNGYDAATPRPAMTIDFLGVSDATVLLGLLGGVQSSKLLVACDKGSRCDAATPRPAMTIAIAAVCILAAVKLTDQKE